MGDKSGESPFRYGPIQRPLTLRHEIATFPSWETEMLLWRKLKSDTLSERSHRDRGGCQVRSVCQPSPSAYD
jgi:hypothetical protein